MINATAPTAQEYQKDLAETVSEIHSTGLYQGAAADEKQYLDRPESVEIIHSGLTKARLIGYQNWEPTITMEWELLRVIRFIYNKENEAAGAAGNTAANQKKFAGIVPAFSLSFQPGAILSDSWGCEQTNIDFYCVVARSGDWVTVLPMHKETGPEVGFMTNKEKPAGINWGGAPIRKKLKVFNGKESGFSFRNYSGGGWCDLWNGYEKTSTHYA